MININSRTRSDNGLDTAGVMSGNPDYKNVQYNADGSLSVEPDPEVEAVAASFGEQIRILGGAETGPVSPGHR